MKSSIGFLALVLVSAVLTGTSFAPSASADDQHFKFTGVFRLVSVQQEGNEVLIHAEGGGVSPLLGPVTATATVTQSTVADPCFAFSADFDLSATDGTIQLHSEGQVCSPPSQITGAWHVTGGTGGFAGATGSGTEQGKASFVGLDPVVDRLEGTLSY